MSRAFHDTNVLVYAVTLDDRRRQIAQHLLMQGGSISVQCLNEFMSVATRKLAMSWQRAEASRDELLALVEKPIALTFDLHRLAMALADRYRLAVYDALIVAAALQADCSTLYSEDMHAGLVVDGRLTITNPFA